MTKRLFYIQYKILFVKGNIAVIAAKVNCFFNQIAIKTKVSKKTKKGNLLQDWLLGETVELTTLSANEIWDDLNIILEIINSVIK